MLIPKYDGPAEGARHATWLQEGHVDHEARIKSLETEVARLARMIGALRRAPNVAPEPVQSGPLPEPYRTGMVLRALGDGSSPQWVPDWQGLMPHYNVQLSSSGSSYEVLNMNIGADDTYESPTAKAALPPLEFGGVNGTTLLPIRATDHADSPTPGAPGGQTPLVLWVDVYPTFAGETFEIHVPYVDHTQGSCAPFYKLAITNSTAYAASIDLRQGPIAGIFYAGTSVPIMGVAPDDSFTVAAGGRVAWHVENFVNLSAAATPVYTLTDGWLDPYFAANLA